MGEAQTKAEAAKILSEKSREISIKKLKQRLSFKKYENKASEQSDKSALRIHEIEKKLGDAQTFNKKVEGAQSAVENAKQAERIARRKLFEGQARKSFIANKEQKSEEREAKAKIKEDTSRKAAQVDRDAYEEEQRKEKKKERAKKQVLAVQMKEKEEKAGVIEQKLDELSQKSEETKKQRVEAE